jgi:transposase
MNNKKRKLTARKTWVKTYQELGSVSKAARRCGIPRSTLYRWLKRFEISGESGLNDLSQKPKKLAKQKITTKIEKLILKFRRVQGFGPQRISTHLLREHKIKLSAPTVWRVLKNYAVAPLKRYRKRQEIKRYSRPIPGDRVQIDVTKI